MKKVILYLILSFFLFGFCGQNCNFNTSFAANKSGDEVSINISAKSAYLIDYKSGTVIYEKNQNERLPVASMIKLALLAVVIEAIEKSAIKLSEEVTVSKYAASIGGSSAFLDAGSKYKVADLIKTVIIASANDSAVALAQHISGTEENFVLRMNKFAESLNLKDTHFENCTGLPKENHYSSAFDMAQIYKAICDNEIYKTYSKIWMDELMHPSGRKTSLVNTNRLIKTFDGIEGGKTGYTDTAKFCLTASARRGDMRLIGVVIGAEDSKTRFSQMSKLFDFGFANFKSVEVVNSKVPVDKINLVLAKNSAEVYPEKDVVKFMEKNSQQKFSVDYEICADKAPLYAGDVVGKLYVFDENNIVVDEINLIIKKDIEALKISDLLKNIIYSW